MVYSNLKSGFLRYDKILSVGSFYSLAKYRGLDIPPIHREYKLDTLKDFHAFFESGTIPILDDYNKAFIADWYNLLEKHLILSEDNIRQPFDTLYYILSDELSPFNAWITRDILLKRTRIHVNRSLLYALDDFYLRVVCNKKFFSWFSKTNSWRWQGCACFYPSGFIIPNIRYNDYSFNDDAINIDFSNFHLGEYVTVTVPDKEPFFHDLTSFYSRYISGAPLKDQSRVELAQLFVFISFQFILFHEEGHYWEGHLMSTPKQPKSFLSLSETNTTDIKKHFDIDPAVFKVYEWQADRNAARDLADMFANLIISKDFPSLPEYCQDEYLCWLIRSFLVSIGSVFLLMEKARLLMRTTSLYPSPCSRYYATFALFLDRILSRKEIKESVPNLINLIITAIEGSIQDLHIANVIVNNEVDIEFSNSSEKEMRDFSKSVGPNEIFSAPAVNFLNNQNDINDFLSAVQHVLIGEELSPTAFDKWAKETIASVKLHDTIVFPSLKENRKRATASGKSIYGE